MARLWSSGIELQSVTSGVEFSGVNGDVTIDLTYVHGGVASLMIGSYDTPLVSGASQYVEQQFAAANGDGPYYFRAHYLHRFDPSAQNRIIELRDTSGNVIVYVTVDSTEKLRLFDEDGQIGSETISLDFDEWYRIELMVDRTGSAGSHIVRARVSGPTIGVHTIIGESTSRSLSAGVAVFRVGGNLANEANTAGRWVFDDLAINDGTGSYQNSYPGRGYIRQWKPNSFYDSLGGNPVGSTGAGCISEVTPDDATTYYQLQEATDFFRTYVDSGYRQVQSTVIQVGCRDRMAAAGAASYLLRLYSPMDGHTAYQEATVPVTTTNFSTNGHTTPHNYLLTSYVSPASGLPWTDDEIYDAFIGAFASDVTPDVDITTLWMLVEYDDHHLLHSDQIQIAQSIDRYKNGSGPLHDYFLDLYELDWGFYWDKYMDGDWVDGDGLSVSQMTLLEDFFGGHHWFQTLTDTLTLTPTIIAFKIYVKTIADTMTVGANLIRKTVKLLSETITPTETIGAIKVTNRYWVGGAGNINDTAHWSLTSGGASGASVPTSAENAILDAASFAADGTITFNADFNCRNLDCSALDQVVTFGASTSRNVNVYGSLKLKSTMIIVSNLYWYMLGSTTETIDLNAGTFNSFYLRLNGGGVYTFQSNGTMAALYPNNGVCDFNGKTLTFVNDLRIENDTPGSIFLIFGAAIISIGGSFGFGRSTNTQFVDPGTSSISLTGNGSIFDNSRENYPKNLYDVSINCALSLSSGYTLPGIIGGKFTMHNLTLVGGAIRDAVAEIASDQVVTGTFTATGNSVINRLRVQKTLYGNFATPITITATAKSFANVDFRQIAGVGAAAPFSGTSIGDAGMNTGITGTTPVTRYWVGNTGNYSDTAHWSATSGGSGGASVPLPQDTVIFDGNSITADDSVVTLDYVDFGASLNLSALTKRVAFVFQSYAIFLYGNLTSSSLVSWTAEATNPQFRITGGGSTIDLRFNTTIFPASLLVSNGGGLVVMQDSVTIDGSINVYDAYLDLNGKALTTDNITCWPTGGSISGLYLGEGSLTTKSFGANSGARIYWETATIYLVNENAGDQQSLFLVSMSTGTPKNVIISSKNLRWYGGMGTIQNLVFNSGANVTVDQNTLTITASLIINGLDGGFVTLAQTPGYSYFTFSAASGVTVTSQYANLTNVRSTGGSIFKTKNSVDNGGNTGWIFFSVPEKMLTDALALSDSITKARSAIRTFIESLTLTESMKRTTTKVLSSALTITATIIRAFVTWVRTFADTVTITGTAIKKATKPFANTLTITSSLTRAFVKRFTSVLTLFEQFDTSTTLHRTLTDALQIVESFVKIKTRFIALTDSVTLSDVSSAIKLTLKVIANTLAIADRFVIRLNGKVTALWSRVHKSTSMWTPIAKDRATWNPDLKSSPEWERQQRDL